MTAKQQTCSGGISLADSANRIQLTTDGHKVDLEVIEGGVGGNVDYAMLMKMYGDGEGGDNEPAEKRYSPAECTSNKNRES